MEHRKRSMNQQKVELTFLLRIVMANGRNRKILHNTKAAQNIIRTLAIEALKSLEDSDHCEVTVKSDAPMAAFQ